MSILKLRNSNGDELVFDDPFWPGKVDGLGMPPVEHHTTRGVTQHGATLRSIYLRPRTISIPFTAIVDTVDAKWAARHDLTAFLASVNTPYNLVVIKDDNTERWLDVAFAGALSLPLDPETGPMAFKDVIQFIAYDPTWYDPVSTQWVYRIYQGAGTWGYPVGFPKGFGGSGLSADETKVYPGTWEARPIITIHGPASSMQIENLTAGTKLEFVDTYAIGATESIVIDLRYGHKSIKSSLNGSIPHKLTTDSDLGQWRILPHPEAPGGANHIQVSLAGGSADTQVSLAFNVRYVGI